MALRAVSVSAGTAWVAVSVPEPSFISKPRYIVTAMVPPLRKSGEVVFNGDIRLDQLKGRALRDFRPKIQLIFQDPFSSLSPRLPVGETEERQQPVWEGKAHFLTADSSVLPR